MIRYYDRTEQRHKILNRVGLSEVTVISDVWPSHEALLAECSSDSRNPGVILCAKHPKFDPECFYRAKLMMIKINRPDSPLKLRFLDDEQELHIHRKDTRLLLPLSSS